jgi:hypothetical protein
MYQQGTLTKFGLVGPTHGRPYVWPESHPLGTDGACLGRLTRHHASLYETSRDGKTLKLVAMGDCRQDPADVTLDGEQTIWVNSGVVIAEHELANPASPA